MVRRNAFILYVQQQILRLNNERFTVPEILFHPSDLGISQMGIPEAICHSISVCPSRTQPHLYANILLTGGCTLFPGFRERVEAEVRSRAPVDLDVRVTLPEKWVLDPLCVVYKYIVDPSTLQLQNNRHIKVNLNFMHKKWPSIFVSL